MLSVNQQKFILSLHHKKYRQKYRKFIVEGTKMLNELLSQSRLNVAAIYGIERWATENHALLGPVLHKFGTISETELGKISALTTPNQVLAVVDMPDDSMPPRPTGGVIYTDGLQDPGNLGAILRIADWFGLEAVWVSSDTVDAYNPKVVQAGMGACLRVPVYEIDLATHISALSSIPLIGAVLDGAPLPNARMPMPGILVIGNEGRGIRPETERLLTHRVTIPRGGQGQAESLNASVATGILAAAWMRAI